VAGAIPGVDLDRPTRETLVRGALWPSWVVTAALLVPFALGVSVPPRLQYVPLVGSVVLLGLPHGAVDHLALPRVRGETPTLRRIGVVVLVYLVLGIAYAALWFLAPVVAFAFFILLTWAHWGQGDLYALLAFVDADYLRTRGQRVLATVVRGGLPMLVPLLAFPDWYRRVGRELVSLFGLGSLAPVAWVFTAETRLTLGAGYAAVVLAYLAVAVVRSESNWHALGIDAAEIALLVVYFALVPPLVAIGVYFSAWHALRHVARLLLLDGDSRTTLGKRRLWPALRQFAVEATPLTLAALALLGGLYLLVPSPPTDVPGIVALYLVLIAVLTLPHVAIVAWMDREQSVWA
jgi:Brp/Blh family beta-carotene 15,15'-monooxygenase